MMRSTIDEREKPEGAWRWCWLVSRCQQMDADYRGEHLLLRVDISVINEKAVAHRQEFAGWRCAQTSMMTIAGPQR